jgi:hypothetical protein
VQAPVIEMNLQIINIVPPGDFEEVSMEKRGWEERFLRLVQQRKHITYRTHDMPKIPPNIQDELNKACYCDVISEHDKWQHFLVPPSN